jgi:CheY-like chemotaxis protein
MGPSPSPETASIPEKPYMDVVDKCPILLAEDEQNDVFLIKRAFQRVQLLNPVRVVSDGQEAINYLRGDGQYADRERFPMPTLVLLDLKMPRMGGFDVISWVRQQPGLKRLPLVVLTSSKDGPDINRAYELGANTYLVKPVEFDGLVEMMKTLNLYWLIMAERPDCWSKL